MLLEGQAGCKPVLQIYTAAGRLVSQHLVSRFHNRGCISTIFGFQWKDAPPVALGWSVSEDLIVVQKTGFSSILDLAGNYVRRFSMGQEAEQREVVDVRFFTMLNVSFP